MPSEPYLSQVSNTPAWNPAIVADLVELLMQPDAQWYEIEELVEGRPWESQFVQLLRANAARATRFASSQPFAIFGLSLPSDFLLDEDARQILMHHVFPYATLLDMKLTPLQQAQQLEQNGVAVEPFCRRLVSSGEQNYNEAAQAALNAWLDHSRLLRGAERAPESNPQLLRPASEAATDTNTLLQASNIPDAEPELPKRGLLHRLLHKP